MKQLFYHWIKKHLGENDHLGDLAHDILRDAHAPKKAKTLEEWEFYLMNKNGVCSEAITCLKLAWEEYSNDKS